MLVESNLLVLAARGVDADTDHLQTRKEAYFVRKKLGDIRGEPRAGKLAQIERHRAVCSGWRGISSARALARKRRQAKPDRQCKMWT